MRSMIYDLIVTHTEALNFPLLLQIVFPVVELSHYCEPFAFASIRLNALCYALCSDEA